MMNRVTQGAAAIVVVLATLLLLGAILAISSQLALSSRQTNADQGSTLRAQYVAESNLAGVRNNLRNLQNMMSEGERNNPNFAVPQGTSIESIKGLAANFCGYQNYNSIRWTQHDDIKDVANFVLKDIVRDQDGNIVPGDNGSGGKGDGTVAAQKTARWCEPADTTAAGVKPGKVMAQYVTARAYEQYVPEDFRPAVGGEEAFWNELFTKRDNKFAGDNARFSLRPLGMLEIKPGQYRFYIGADNPVAKGDKDKSSRVLSTQTDVQNGAWYFDIIQPMPTDKVLFTKEHKSGPNQTRPNVNFVNGQIFDGDVHTNENFLFLNNGVDTVFKGNVTSAGCKDISAYEQRLAIDKTAKCESQSGYYVGQGGFEAINLSIEDKDERNSELANRLSNVSWGQKDDNGDLVNPPNFEANYVGLPTNLNDQKAMAEAGGIVVPTGAKEVSLVAAGNDGVPLSNYDSTQKKWVEKSPMYQYISITTQNDGYIGYRIDENGNMQQRTSQTGAWSGSMKFNGVIYGSDIPKLTGPGRPAGAAVTAGERNVEIARPAIASFMQLTVAAENNVGVASDLAMSETPCTNTEVEEGSCDREPKNVLGVYAQKGDVIINARNPDNTTVKELELQTILMSSQGRVRVEGWDTTEYSGAIHLTGSLIENYYGFFGRQSSTSINVCVAWWQWTYAGWTEVNFPTNNGCARVEQRSETIRNGYLRNFTHDPRFKKGVLPPYFPTSGNWTIQTPQDGARGLANVLIRNENVGEFK